MEGWVGGGEGEKVGFDLSPFRFVSNFSSLGLRGPQGTRRYRYRRSNDGRDCQDALRAFQCAGRTRLLTRTYGRYRYRTRAGYHKRYVGRSHRRVVVFLSGGSDRARGATINDGRQRRRTRNLVREEEGFLRSGLCRLRRYNGRRSGNGDLRVTRVGDIRRVLLGGRYRSDNSNRRRYRHYQRTRYDLRFLKGSRRQTGSRRLQRCSIICGSYQSGCRCVFRGRWVGGWGLGVGDPTTCHQCILGFFVFGFSLLVLLRAISWDGRVTRYSRYAQDGSGCRRTMFFEGSARIRCLTNSRRLARNARWYRYGNGTRTRTRAIRRKDRQVIFNDGYLNASRCSAICGGRQGRRTRHNMRYEGMNLRCRLRRYRG